MIVIIVCAMLIEDTFIVYWGYIRRLWIIVISLRLSRIVVSLTVFTVRRSSVKDFACESTSTVVVNVCYRRSRRCRAAVAWQRQLLLSSPPSGCDVRCILSTEFDDCSEDLFLVAELVCVLQVTSRTGALRFVVYATVNLSKSTLKPWLITVSLLSFTLTIICQYHLLVLPLLPSLLSRLEMPASQCYWRPRPWLCLLSLALRPVNIHCEPLKKVAEHLWS